jgi:hypothetical protein
MVKKGVDKSGALDFLAGLRCIDPAKPNSRASDEAESARATSLAYDPAADPFRGMKIKKPEATRRNGFKIVASWAYTDETGAPLFEVCRMEMVKSAKTASR